MRIIDRSWVLGTNSLVITAFRIEHSLERFFFYGKFEQNAFKDLIFRCCVENVHDPASSISRIFIKGKRKYRRALF